MNSPSWLQLDAVRTSNRATLADIAHELHLKHFSGADALPVLRAYAASMQTHWDPAQNDDFISDEMTAYIDGICTLMTRLIR